MKTDVSALQAVPARAPGAGWAHACALDVGHVADVRAADGAVAWAGSPWTPPGSPDGEEADSAVVGDEAGCAALLEGMTGAVVLPVQHAHLVPPGAEGERFAVRTLADVPPPADRPDPPGAARWLDPGDPRVAPLVAAHFPDAETPPSDPRVQRWMGWEVGDDLPAVCCRLRTGPGLALLSGLTLDPVAGGRGIATALARAFCVQVLAGGAELVALGHYASNTSASRLYDVLGMGRVDLVFARMPGPQQDG